MGVKKAKKGVLNRSITKEEPNSIKNMKKGSIVYLYPDCIPKYFNPECIMVFKERSVNHGFEIPKDSVDWE